MARRVCERARRYFGDWLSDSRLCWIALMSFGVSAGPADGVDAVDSDVGDSSRVSSRGPLAITSIPVNRIPTAVAARSRTLRLTTQNRVPHSSH